MHHVPRQRGAEQLLSADLGAERTAVEFVQVSLQVRVGVRVAVCEVAGVLCVRKFTGPGEAVVTLLLGGLLGHPVLEVVLVVEHILPVGGPAYGQI